MGAVELAAAGIAGRLAAGNSVATREVALGQAPICATDTDDVNVLQMAEQKIAMTYPDMGDGGTLLLPNAAGIIKNGPHLEAARELMTFLCSDFVEEAWQRASRTMSPVQPALRDKLGIRLPPTSPVDYAKVNAQCLRR